MRSSTAMVSVSLALLATAMGASAEAAVASAPPGSIGYDVSYPQCNRALPTGGTFGIVGVTGGRPFSANPCLSGEYATVSSGARPTALYINTANPGPAAAHWGLSDGSTRANCVEVSSAADPGCAYNYGWNAAADAIAVARAAAVPVAGSTWWLDVETVASWRGDAVANAADVQGALDYLRGHGVDEVGVYSTTKQWQRITGGYTADSAAAYQRAWQQYFTPAQSLAEAPLWIAGVGDRAAAAAACARTFTGAPARLAQYSDGSGYDADMVCDTPAAVPPPVPAAPRVPTVPRSPTAHAAHRHGVTLRWRAPASNGGSPIDSYLVLRGTASHRETAIATVPCHSSRCAWTDAATRHKKRYYYVLRATNTAGQGPASKQVSARAR